MEGGWFPVSGTVADGTAMVTSDWPLPEGATVEGWAFETVPPRPSDEPMTTDEARRLLGHPVVVALNRRGIDIRRLDWSVWIEGEFTSTTWYRVIRTLDYADPWPIWTPLFAHLLRLVETHPGEVWLHMSDVGVVTTGLLERYRVKPVASNARLIALMMLRIVEFCREGGRIGAHHLDEIESEARLVLQACLEAEERET